MKFKTIPSTVLFPRLYGPLWVAITMVILSACGPERSGKSTPSGHYENSDALDQAQFINQQLVIPEHYRTQAVIVGLPLLETHHREDLIQAILEAGAPKIYLVVPQGFSMTQNAVSVLQPLRDLLGDRMSQVEIVENGHAGVMSVWARDWTPLFARGHEKGDLRMVDMNYYPNRESDDFAPQSLVKAMPLPRITLPIYNEGGNFMINGRGECLLTDRVSRANRRRYRQDDMLLTEEDISKLYMSFAGCRRVLLFPRMDYEVTGHIDVWAKFLNDSTIAVGEIRDNTLAGIDPNTQGYRMAKVMKKYLDTRATEIRDFGFQVVRLPMPVPHADKDDVIPSYINSLTVNDTIIVPRYKVMPPIVQRNQSDNIPYLDQPFFAEYEAEIIATHQKFGYKTVFIEADTLVQMGGAIHCVTMQVGDPNLSSAVADSPLPAVSEQ